MATPRIYRWGQSNPALSRGPSKGVSRPGAFSYAPGKATPSATPAASAAAAPAAPAAGQVPSAPSSAVLPPDPSYEQTVGALGRQRDTTLSGLSGQRTQGLLNYGYNENAAGGLAFDPSNPYSQAAQMKKRYDESRQGTGNSMAARGQLYAGAYQQGQDIINRDQGKGEHQLMKSLTAFLAGNTSARGKAQTDYELGVAGAQGDRIARAPSSPLYSPTADAAPAGTPAAAAQAPLSEVARIAAGLAKRKTAKGWGRI